MWIYRYENIVHQSETLLYFDLEYDVVYIDINYLKIVKVCFQMLKNGERELNP